MITDIQRASLSKRIAAGIFDAMLICVLAVGFAWMLTSILNYNSYSAELANYYSQYEQSYGVDFGITESDYLELSDAERKNFDEASLALSQDEGAMKTYSLLLNLTMIATTFSILLAILLIEFFIPLFLKNGQTIGKKIFGIALVRTDSVRLTPVQLFVRTVLGKFTIETMIPVYIVIMMLFKSIGITGLIVIGGMLLLQLILLIVTKTNSLIHDTLAGTVAVDFSSQMIFRTSEDLIAYKEKIHAEQVARSFY